MKSSVIATMLNIIPGFGYIYIGGKKRWFGVLLVLGLGLALYMTLSGPAFQVALDQAMAGEGTADLNFSWLSTLSSFVMIGAFMFDAYWSCEQANREYDSKIKKLIDK